MKDILLSIIAGATLSLSISVGLMVDDVKQIANQMVVQP